MLIRQKSSVILEKAEFLVAGAGLVYFSLLKIDLKKTGGQFFFFKLQMIGNYFIFDRDNSQIYPN